MDRTYINRIKRVLFALLIIFALALISEVLEGCKREESKEKEEIEFTVCDESRIPPKLLEQIVDKRNESFEMTFTEGGYLYIAKGYGKQETGGYSIQVNELAMSKDAISFSTKLIGPGEKDLVLRGNTYPYIVVKMEEIDKKVEFI